MTVERVAFTVGQSLELFIEGIAEKAKAGEIIGLVAIGICPDGGEMHYWAGQTPVYQTIGALDVAKDDFKRAFVEIHPEDKE